MMMMIGVENYHHNGNIVVNIRMMIMMMMGRKKRGHQIPLKKEKTKKKNIINCVVKSQRFKVTSSKNNVKNIEKNIEEKKTEDKEKRMAEKTTKNYSSSSKRRHINLILCQFFHFFGSFVWFGLVQFFFNIFFDMFMV